MRNILSVLAILTTATLLFSGCADVVGMAIGQEPQAYVQKLPEAKGVSKEAQQRVVDAVVARYWPGVDYDGCMSVKQRAISGSIQNYRNCFEVQADGTVKRMDRSSITDKSGRTKDFHFYYMGVDNYVKAIENIQQNLNKDFAAYIFMYNDQYKSELEALVKKRDQVLKTHKFIVKGAENIISDSVRKKLSQNIKAEAYGIKDLGLIYAEYMFFNNGQPGRVNGRGMQYYRNASLEDFMLVHTSLPYKKLNDHLHIDYFQPHKYLSKDKYGKSYQALYAKGMGEGDVHKDSTSYSPEAIFRFDKAKDSNFYISKVSYRYAPDIFEGGNKDLQVKFDIKNHTLFLANKSSKQMIIDTISGYYGEDITTMTKKDQTITLAPMSKQEFNTHGYAGLSKFPNEAALEVKDPKLKVNFGFAINYKLSGQSTSETLLNVNKYGIAGQI